MLGSDLNPRKPNCFALYMILILQVNLKTTNMQKLFSNADILSVAKATAEEVAKQVALTAKEFLTREEVASYLGVSLSCVNKMAMKRVLPFYKPMGKNTYCKRTEVEQWLQHNRIATNEELEAEAQKYVSKKGGIK